MLRMFWQPLMENGLAYPKTNNVFSSSARYIMFDKDGIHFVWSGENCFVKIQNGGQYVLSEISEIYFEPGNAGK